MVGVRSVVPDVVAVGAMEVADGGGVKATTVVGVATAVTEDEAVAEMGGVEVEFVVTVGTGV